MKKFLGFLLCGVFLLGFKNMATFNRTTSDTVYRPGKPLAVMIHVIPNSVVKSYGIEETPPAGWGVSGISNGGNFVGGLIKYGIFNDNIARDFHYTVIPPSNQKADGIFSGVISFDGSSTTITGVTTIPRDLMPPASPK